MKGAAEGDVTTSSNMKLMGWCWWCRRFRSIRVRPLCISHCKKRFFVSWYASGVNLKFGRSSLVGFWVLQIETNLRIVSNRKTSKIKHFHTDVIPSRPHKVNFFLPVSDPLWNLRSSPALMLFYDFLQLHRGTTIKKCSTQSDFRGWHQSSDKLHYY